MRRNLRLLALGLLNPDRAFLDAGGAKTPRVVLAVALYLAAVLGARMGVGVALSPESRLLAIRQVDARLGSFMAGAPPEAQAQARDRMLDALLGQSSARALAISMAFSGVSFLLIMVELWLLTLVVTQFFGGQEERSGRFARPSLDLYLVAFVPLALRRLVAGVLAAARAPEAALNALTLEEYRAASEVRFDALWLLGTRGLPAILEAALRLLTDPFVLWSLAILVLGGRRVFRVPLKAALGQVAILVAVLSLQAWLLGLAGLRWEV